MMVYNLIYIQSTSLRYKKETFQTYFSGGMSLTYFNTSSLMLEC